MSLFGSLFTGVSALTAQSQSMGMISNNIANVNTVGYKKREAAFSSLVTSESRAARYTPGSVIARAAQKIDQQGAIQQTNSTTDIAISGNGFFVVQRAADGLQEKLYTRAGSFSEDASGALRNTAGFYLMGWPLDQDGNLPAGQADISALRPVDVAFLGGLTRPTTNGELAINLNAAEAKESYPVSSTATPDFKRALRVYDSLGTGQDIEFQFTKHTSPTAYARTGVGGTGLTLTSLLTSVTGVDATETISITVGADTINYTVDGTSTVQNLVDFINSDATIGGKCYAELDSTGQLKITASNLADTVTVGNGATTVGATGAATALGFTTTAAPAAPTIFPGGTASLENVPNPEGWWQLKLVNATTGAVLSNGSINFNTDGTINANTDVDGDVKITLSNVEWGNGSSPQTLDLKLNSISQFAGAYNVIYSNQNGAELGLRTGVEIDRDGVVTARFSNGQSAKLYKLPIATFTNTNGLSEQSGNAYIQSTASGSFNLREAGQGGAGLVEGSSVEISNVDLADEFSKMIITQRAYSAGTKVISTADEMTEELLRLR